jgi:hypothetical protein
MQGIFIFQTSDGFRVAPIGNYDALYDGYMSDMSQYIFIPYFEKVFGSCKALTEIEALDVAKTMAIAYNELPDGIRIVTTYRNYSFEDIMNGKVSKNNRTQV